MGYFDVYGISSEILTGSRKRLGLTRIRKSDWLGIGRKKLDKIGLISNNITPWNGILRERERQ